MLTLGDRPVESDAAVVDVGSNSVRLVLYRVEGRALWTVFNEKVLAGLGRDLSATGKLSPEGAGEALAVLRRFSALLEGVPKDRIFTAATAAIREAKDGQAFADRVRHETGLKLRILSGVEEAHYSALGVLAGAPQSRGIAADLGGASLELTHLHDGGAGKGVSLPVGPFAMGALGDTSPERLRKKLRSFIEPHAKAFKSEVLNAVGGSWRNLALLQMRITDYPLHIVHQYSLSGREALDAAQFVSRQSRGSLERIEGLSRKRVETLPHAAALLEVLIEELNLQRIVISAYGLREGLIFDAMDKAVQARDPLLEGCAAWGGRQGVATELGQAVETWLRPAFGALPAVFGDRDPTLIAAACRLADVGVRLHPDHRADLVFDQVLRAPIAGMNHAERYFLAAACFARHTASGNVREPEMAQRLLTRERIGRARALGAAIRLACDLSGRNPGLLARSSLGFEGERVVLRAETAYADMLLGEQTAKRAQTLATLLGRRLE
jgi:exopolyphosphatase/guanosine-5'-triphosphate,3'-diphosphate pyrophosphatase